MFVSGNVNAKTSPKDHVGVGTNKNRQKESALAGF